MHVLDSVLKEAKIQKKTYVEAIIKVMARPPSNGDNSVDEEN